MTRRRTVVALAALALLAGACGSRVEREASLPANGVVAGAGVDTAAGGDVAAPVDPDEAEGATTPSTVGDGSATSTTAAGGGAPDTSAPSGDDAPTAPAGGGDTGPLVLAPPDPGTYRYEIAGTDAEVLTVVTAVSQDPTVQDWTIQEGERSGRQRLAWEADWIVEREVEIDLLAGQACTWDPPIQAVPRSPEPGQTWEISSRCQVSMGDNRVTVVSTGTGEVVELSSAEVLGATQRVVRIKRSEQLRVELGGQSAGSGTTDREQVVAADGVVVFERTTLTSPIENGDVSRRLVGYDA